MRLGKGLHFLFSRLGWCCGGFFIAVICALWDPELVKMMVESGASGASSPEASVTQAPQSNGSDAGPSGTPSSEASVNQQPVIPELHPPLLDDNTRRQELNDRLGIHWVGMSYNPEVRDSFVQTQLQIETQFSFI